MEIVLIVAVAENGVIGAGGAIPWRLKSDMAALQGDDVGQARGDGTQDLRLDRPAASRTDQYRRDARSRAFAPTASWSPHSFADATAIATGDALRRFATEIAVIGGAEIYAQWMDVRRSPGNHRSACPARGRYAFRRHRCGRLGRGGARAESGRSRRQRRLLLCDISSAQALAALTSLTNVCIDNYGVRHSCFEPEACVVRDLAVPYKAGRICEA